MMSMSVTQSHREYIVLQGSWAFQVIWSQNLYFFYFPNMNISLLMDQVISSLNETLTLIKINSL